MVLGSPLKRLAAAGLLGRYLALFAWPSCLSSDYSLGSLPLPNSAWDPWIVGSLFLAAAIAAALAWTLRRRLPAAGFGLSAFAASYLLISNAIVLLGTIMAERLFFMPAWGLSIALAGLLVAAHDRLLPEGASRKAVAAAAIVLLIVPLAARTWARIGDWKSNASLADSVHRCYPGNVKVLVVLAEREARVGRHVEARALYEQAIAAGPDASYARAAMGVYLLDRGETERALALLESNATSRTPVPGATLRLALSYLDRTRDDDAFRAATRALEAGPSYGDAAMAHVVRGEVLLRRSDPAGAANEYRLAIRESPGEPVAHFNLGRVLEAQGRLEEALEELARADALAPKDPRILYARAFVEAKLGRPDRSLETIERLEALDPPLAAEARRRLAGTGPAGQR